MKSVILVVSGTLFVFMPIYYMFFTINLGGLADNGYDAARFLNTALNSDISKERISTDQLIVIFLIGKTVFFGMPLYSIFLFFISILFLHRISAALNIKAQPVLYYIFATPILIVYLETGKDILVFTSMIFLFGFIKYWRQVYYSNSIIVSALLLSILMCSLVLCFLIKGLTVLIYFSLVFFMAMRGGNEIRSILGLILISAGFVLGFVIRGPVDLLTVQNQTSFSSAYLISDDSIAKAIVSGLTRLIVYFTSPVWYWIVMFKNLLNAPGLIFHAYGYLILAYGVWRLKFWRNLTFIVAACLFSFCYPFVHLRYFFTFVIFWLVMNSILDQRRQPGA